MYDVLTPDGAIQERDAILQMLSIPGAMRIPPTAKKDSPYAELGRMALIETLKNEVPKSEIVIWDHALYVAATAGADAFEGSPVPIEYFTGNSQIWMFAKDMQVHPTTRDALGLKGDWLVIAHLFVRSVVPHISTDMLADIQSKFPAPMFEELLARSSHSGKPMVDGLTIFARGEEWLRGHTNPSTEDTAFYVTASQRVGEGDVVKPNSSYAIAAYLFMNSTVAQAQEFTPNHDTRKKYKRANLVPPTVKAVVLRRTERDEKPTGRMRSDVEYSCQWIVGAHWRKPSPLMKEQRPVYVRPYVKGPTDKPFRAPQQTVYIANR